MTDTLQLPSELTDRRQWIIWRFGDRDGKRTKLPCNVNTGAMAKSTDPADWFTFDEAVNSQQPKDGVGFVFVKGGGMVGVDLDNCIDGNDCIKPWADKIIAAFDTYSEISPSGNGIKMWVRGKLPSERGTRHAYEDGEVEMYDWGRYFTVTGRRYADSPLVVVERQRYIEALFNKLCPPPAAEVQQVRSDRLDDQIIVEKLLSEPNHKGARLWSGNTSDYTSGSEADAALVSKLAFYTQDPAQIERLFAMSGMCREKWTKRADYRKTTIEWALKQTRETYQPAVNRSEQRQAESPKRVEITKPNDAGGLGDLLQETIDGKRRNIEWPFPELTDMARSLLPGTLTVLCGGAGSTKSMLVSQATLYWQEFGVPFAVFHLEEDREFHLNRALAQIESNSGLTLDDYIRDNPDVVLRAYDRDRELLDDLSNSMWDAPLSDLGTEDMIDWVAERAAEGRRIIIVDPITAADSGREPWAADRRFVLQTKRIMREHGASLIVVTHPRDGNVKGGGNHLDNIAGGRAYNRFTQTVLILESLDKVEQKTVARGFEWQSVSVNRTVTIRKARSGTGVGRSIGFFFDSETLLLTERGAITEAN
jgi:KaiC/GvpD/RAD55 family RecA-like ATPase